MGRLRRPLADLHLTPSDTTGRVPSLPRGRWPFPLKGTAPLVPSLLASALDADHVISLGGLLSPIVTVIVSLVLGWFLNRIDKKADRAGNAAALAAQRAAPTGNGYAQRTEDALSWLKAEVGGIRADHRDTNRRLDALTTRVNAHLEGGNTNE